MIKDRVIMDGAKKTVISLIKSAIYKEKTVLPYGFDWGYLRRIIGSQEIYELVYCGAVHSGIPTPNWLRNKFLERVATLTGLWQKSAEISEEFDKRGIEYVLLKGVVVKDLYPDAYMRHMSDIDILIREEDYKEKIKPVMVELGYTEGEESDHELHWIKNGHTVELHKRIIPSYNKDFFKVVGDGWEWLKQNNYYSYLVAHFAKHYRDSGIGITHLVDLEICKDKMNLQSIEELHLTEFYENLKATLDCWFRGKEFDAKTEFITDRIFKSGMGGSVETAKRAGSLKMIKAAGGSVKKARLKHALILLFPPLSLMKQRYRILKPLPFLLPLFWALRGICAPFRGNIKRNIESNKEIKEDGYKKELEYVGLDFWF